MRRARSLVALLVLAACAAGCGAGTTGPTQVVQNYLTAIAEGEYDTACALLDSRARATLPTAPGQHLTCQAVFSRCVPNQAASFARDQTQELYANVDLTTDGSTAVAVVSGTLVARTVKEVTLANEHGTWKLTSYGQILRRCQHGGLPHGHVPPPSRIPHSTTK